jgi:hypothetical protein
MNVIELKPSRLPSPDKQRDILKGIKMLNDVLNLVQKRQFEVRKIDNERYWDMLKNLEVMVINQRREMKGWLTRR